MHDGYSHQPLQPTLHPIKPILSPTFYPHTLFPRDCPAPPSLRYFVGYELRLWVRDETDGEGVYWRSVQQCEVTGHEWDVQSVDSWEGPEIYFKQHIHIMYVRVYLEGERRAWGRSDSCSNYSLTSLLQSNRCDPQDMARFRRFCRRTPPCDGGVDIYCDRALHLRCVVCPRRVLRCVPGAAGRVMVDPFNHMPWTLPLLYILRR